MVSSVKERCKTLWLHRPAILFIAICIILAVLASQYNEYRLWFGIASGVSAVIAIGLFVGKIDWTTFGKGVVSILESIGIVLLVIIFWPFIICYLIFKKIVGETFNIKNVKQNFKICCCERPSTVLLLCCIICFSLDGILVYFIISFLPRYWSIIFLVVLVVLFCIFFFAGIIFIEQTCELSGKDWSEYIKRMNKCGRCIKKSPKTIWKGITNNNEVEDNTLQNTNIV